MANVAGDMDAAHADSPSRGVFPGQMGGAGPGGTGGRGHLCRPVPSGHVR